MLFPMILSVALAAAPATAQASPQATGPQAAAPAPATSATVSETEVHRFAGAALTITRAQKDATVSDDDRHKKAADAVAASGIAPDRFNAIAQGMNADPALKQRIQTAALAQAHVKQ
ncbi:DUF4168 domain-containing protein [Sphingomonas xinjiangensis]|uniref:DUF4168 domain-containing protein n=1 Tax=Sphingomonas xinjiangensis TaxID=643568 RepID=A0A840YRH9_9SPHN|nr:DUF4168 domain-containing protein [Sphingomonas xinjiangensis]MBB5712212.1 hypothetical protein [Sphingomonas xinjiangensis]